MSKSTDKNIKGGKVALILSLFNKTRVTVLTALKAVDAYNDTHMSEKRVEISNAAMRNHLKKMALYGVIGTEKEANRLFYVIPDNIIELYATHLKAYVDGRAERNKASRAKAAISMNKKTKLPKLNWGERMRGNPGDSYAMREIEG